MCSLNPSCYNGLWICMCRFHYDEIFFMQNYSKFIRDYYTVAKWHYPLSVSAIFRSVISVNHLKEHSLKKNGFDKHMLYQTERWMKREGEKEVAMRQCAPLVVWVRMLHIPPYRFSLLFEVVPESESFQLHKNLCDSSDRNIWVMTAVDPLALFGNEGFGYCILLSLTGTMAHVVIRDCLSICKRLYLCDTRSDCRTIALYRWERSLHIIFF